MAVAYGTGGCSHLVEVRGFFSIVGMRSYSSRYRRGIALVVSDWSLAVVLR